MKISFWKIVNLLVFAGLVVLSILDPVVTPVLIAYGVVWALFQTRLSGVEVQVNNDENALNLTRLFQGTTSILSNLNDMVGMIGDRIILEDGLDELDNGCDCNKDFNALTDKPKKYMPRVGRKYWAIGDISVDDRNDMSFIHYLMDGDSVDERNIKIGNCFKTKKEAKEAYEKIVELLQS